jgi:hypothetical protein
MLPYVNHCKQLHAPKFLNLLDQHDGQACQFENCCKSCLACKLVDLKAQYWTAKTNKARWPGSFHTKVNRIGAIAGPSPCGNPNHTPTAVVFDISKRADQDDPLPYLQWIISELRRTMADDLVYDNGMVFT